MKPEAQHCPARIRKLVRRAHYNLGHPSNSALVRIMRTARCDKDAIEYAKHTKCPTCIRRPPPQRIPRATMPYRPTRFGHIVGLDLKFLKDHRQEEHVLLNILDMATLYNILVRCDAKRPADILTQFKAYWIKWAGSPEKIVVDQGSEFGAAFLTYTGSTGIVQRLVPIEAPWQHGMVERHGQRLSDIIQAIMLEVPVNGKDESPRCDANGFSGPKQKTGPYRF